MITFLWTMAILSILETIGRIVWLVNGVPERTKKGTAVDLFFGILFSIWVCVLLVTYHG